MARLVLLLLCLLPTSLWALDCKDPISTYNSEELNIPEGAFLGMYSPTTQDYKHVYWYDDGELHIQNLLSGEKAIHKLPKFDDPHSFRLSNNKKFFAAKLSDKLLIYDLSKNPPTEKSLELSKILIDSSPIEYISDAGEALLFTWSGKLNLHRYNINGKISSNKLNTTPVIGAESSGRSSISQTGQVLQNFYTENETNNRTQLFIDGKVKKFNGKDFLPDTYSNIQGTGKPNVFILSRYNYNFGGNTEFFRADFSAGEIEKLDIPSVGWLSHIDENDNQYIFIGPRLFFKKKKLFCPQLLDDELTKSEDYCYSCKPETELLSGLGSLAAQMLCGLPYNESLWENFAPKKPPKSLDKKTAYYYLMKFQKPDGLDVNRDLGVVHSLLRSNLVESNPKLISGMMQNIMAQNPVYFDQVLKEVPELKNVDTVVTDDRVCRTGHEKDEVAEKIRKQILNKISKTEYSGTKLSDWDGLSLLKPILANYPKAQKKELFKGVYNSIAAGATRDPALKGVFFSKLVKFTKQAVKPYFGLEPKSFTDLSLSGKPTDQDEVFSILGTHPIEGVSEGMNEYGFYASEAFSFNSNYKNNEKRIQWTHDGKKYSAKVNMNWVPFQEIAPDSRGPNYDEMWADNKLTGMVAIASNFTGSGVEKLKHHYINYYADRGFEFSEPTEVSNSSEYVRELLKSGEVDYFVKDAHSSGDEKTSIPLASNSLILKGEREVDGKTEVIQIVFPRDERGTSEKLTPSNFREIMEARDKRGGSDLVYLNSSCSSQYLAKNEMAVVSSPNFINLAATSTTTSFSSRSSHPKRSILDGLHEGWNWGEMQAAIEQRHNPNSRYAEYNDFIFPNESRFKESYSPSNGNLPAYDIKVLDQEGQPYNMADHL